MTANNPLQDLSTLVRAVELPQSQYSEVAALRDRFKSNGPFSVSSVETQILTANSSTITFSNLNGDVDGIYLLIARLKITANSIVTLKPNGLATNLLSEWTESIAGVGTSRNDRTDLILAGDNGGTMLAKTFQAHFYAKSGVVRTYTSTYGVASSDRYSVGSSAGYWNETVTNVTSLVINCSAASGLLIGSEARLYKYL
jgi:hypothetical protein